MTRPASTSAQGGLPGRGAAGRPGALMAAAAGLLISVPVTTWWAVGNRSPHVRATLTYDLSPYRMDPRVAQAWVCRRWQ